MKLSTQIKTLVSRKATCIDKQCCVACRFCQMMWRLNFLVVMVCIVLQNSYMLYYICPMHTLFTIMVYAALGLGNRYNKSNLGIACK